MFATERPIGMALEAFDEGVDCWSGDPDAPPRRDLLEESIGVGNKLLEAIADLDARWHESAFDAPGSYDPDAVASIEELYLYWSRVADKLIALARRAEAHGLGIRGLDALLANRELAVASPVDAREMSEGLIALRDEAASEHRAGKTLAIDELDD